MSKTAILAGASGLVGGQLLEELLAAPDFAAIHALVRRPLETRDPKLCQHIVDFAQLDASMLPVADTVFCCLGATMKAAGSRAAFRQVDFQHVVALARLAREAGAQQFLLVGSMGANARSPFFYMRTKGEVEEALRALGYRSATVFRPAYLTGKRQQRRPLEDFSGVLMQALAPIAPASFRPVPARSVARAMLDQARLAPPGFHIIDSAAMQRFR